MITHIKFIWKLARKHWRAFVHDVHWHFSHATFYAKRISAHFKKYPYKQEDYNYWSPPPHDPKKYPYDKQKAESALYEVNEWIREDQRKTKNGK